MPAIVIGADTPVGREIVSVLLGRGGEVRAFVTSPKVGDGLKQAGAKVAVGDLSDASHIAAAAYQAFTAVLIESALHDGRETTFAAVDAVPALWIEALQEAGIRRAIWVDHRPSREVSDSAPEVEHVASVGRSDQDVARRVADLNDAGHP